MGKRICMVVYDDYWSDPRVRRETKALAEAGYSIDVFCLKALHKESCKIAGIGIREIPLRKYFGHHKSIYMLSYFFFFVLSFLYVTLFHFRKKYHLIWIHNPPDALIFITIFPKVLGAKLILDIHDLTPELYISKFNSNFLLHVLFAFERIAVYFADHIFIANDLFKKKILERTGVNPSKITVVENSPDPEFFSQRKNGDVESGKFLLVNHGTIAHRYGLDVAIKAVALLKEKIPKICLEIYGRGEEIDKLERLVSELGLQQQVIFKGYVDHAEISKYLVRADVGVVSLRQDEHTNFAFPTKIFEYIHLGIPVVTSETEIIRFTFPNSSVMYFKPGDERSLAECIWKIYKDKTLKETLVKNSQKLYEAYRWEKVKEKLINKVNKVVGC
jgi:glycosyltransferase involved in cell wall biosynthesis